MTIALAFVCGLFAWFFVRYVLTGFYIIDQNQRAVVTSFGRAHRLGNATTSDLPIADSLDDEEKQRYAYPQVRVVQPGFYWKWPWQRVHRVSIATGTTNMAYDPDNPRANQDGTILEAVTKDQLNIGLDGQIRYRVSEANLYAYIFGVKKPLSHVMGYFVSVLRERIANFEAPPVAYVPAAVGITPQRESDTPILNPSRIAHRPAMLVPARDDALPLYVKEQGSFVGKDGDRIVVRHREAKLISVPLMEVSQVSLFGNVQMSAQALREIVDRGIPVCHFSYGGWFNAMTTGHVHKNIELRIAQFATAADPAKSLALAKGFIMAKMKNCRTMLRRHGAGRGKGAGQDEGGRMKDEMDAGTQRANDIPLLIPSCDASQPVDFRRLD